MPTHAWIESPLGPMLLRAEGATLTGSYFRGQAHFPAEFTWGREEPSLPIFQLAQEQLKEFFQAKRTVFSIPLSLRGTIFQVRVWQALAEIPFGETVTYSGLAAQLGNLNAVRAVGIATGRNPLSWFIPCHRVVGKNGALTGYAGGLEKKRALLALEQTGAPPFSDLNPVPFFQKERPSDPSRFALSV